LKKRTRKRKAEMKRRDLRMLLGKVKRRGLHHLPPVRLVVLLINFFIFCDLNMNKKIKKIK